MAPSGWFGGRIFGTYVAEFVVNHGRVIGYVALLAAGDAMDFDEQPGLGGRLGAVGRLGTGSCSNAIVAARHRVAGPKWFVSWQQQQPTLATAAARRRIRESLAMERKPDLELRQAT